MVKMPFLSLPWEIALSVTFPYKTFHLMPGMMLDSLPFLQEALKGKAFALIGLISLMKLMILPLRNQIGRRKLRKKPLLGKPLNSLTKLDLLTLMSFLDTCLFAKDNGLPDPPPSLKGTVTIGKHEHSIPPYLNFAR